jgi:tetratricopeptide (TPR) repeat protein
MRATTEVPWNWWDRICLRERSCRRCRSATSWWWRLDVTAPCSISRPRCRLCSVWWFWAGPRSLRHAEALQQLCMVYQGLKDFVAASKAIKEALAIMEELGLQRHEWYGSILVTLGGLDFEQGRCKEALAIYDKAKAVLVQYNDGASYGVLLNDMAICHKRLHQWNEASPATRRLLSTSATCTAPTILITQLRCTTLRTFSTSSSSTRRPSRDMRRPSSSTRGCLVTSISRLLLLPGVSLLSTNSLSNQSRHDRCGPHILHVQPVCQDQGKDGVVHWMPPCVVLRQGVPAAALGHAQAAVQCLLALRCGVDQDQALLALSQGQVLRCRVQQSPLG